MKINKANGQSKTEKLHALEVQRDAVLGKMRDLSEPKGAAKFARLTTQIESLAGSFVTYRGREVEARKVNYISGCVPTSSEDLDGDEDLFRDDQGRYYLRRRLAHDKQERVHRITPTAAILWATTRINSETLDLRRDAVAALKASTPTSAVRHSADGSMTLTLHLRPDPARLVRRAAAANEQSELLEIWGCIQSGTVGRIARTHIDQREMEAIFEGNPPGQALACASNGVAHGLVALLDDHCRDMMRAYLAERPDLDLRDVANGAVEFLLGNPDQDDEVCSSPRCIARAKARRINGQPAPAAVTPAPVPILKANEAQVDDGCQHFTFSYPPKAEVAGLRIGIKLDAAQMALAQTPRQPLRSHAAHLPQEAGRTNSARPAQPGPAARREAVGGTDRR